MHTKNSQALKREERGHQWAFQSEQFSLKPKGISSLGVEIPARGQHVLWTGNMRAEVPQYVVDQVHAAAFNWKCTQVAVLLRVLSEYRDNKGQIVFQIRPEDMVTDRRKLRLPSCNTRIGANDSTKTSAGTKQKAKIPRCTQAHGAPHGHPKSNK